MSETVHEEAYPAAETGGGYQPVRVEVVNQQSGCDCGRRKRRSMVVRTFTLTAGGSGVGGGTQTQQILPHSTSRVDAWITAAIAASSPPNIFVAKSEADAQQQSGAAAIVVGLDTAPFPINTTDEVWVSAATASLPVTVSVLAYYEQTEN